MKKQLLFHEKCNEDILSILECLAAREPQRKDHFLTRLTEAYQNLYENEVAGEYVLEKDTFWSERIEKRIHPVCDFSYLVVTTKLRDHITVVLAIISMASYYKMEAAQRIELLKQKL